MAPSSTTPPTSDAARILKQSGLYALGNIAVKASGLLLAPLYLNPSYLSAEDFGYFALLNVTAQLGIFVLGFGIGIALLKFIADPLYERHRQALPFTALTVNLAIAVALFLLTYLLARPLSRVILDSPDRSPLLYLVAIYMALKIVVDIPLVMLRANERAAIYGFAVSAEAVLLIGGVYYFLAVRQLGLTGLLAAYVFSSGIAAVMLLAAMLLRVPWKFAPELLPPLARFAWPLLLSNFAMWFLNFGDRYLLKLLADPAAIGLYEWAARLAGMVNMLFVQSFQLAFSVIGLKALGAGENSELVYRETFRHYVIWTGWATLGLALFARDATRLLTSNPIYLQADPIVLLLSLGFMAYGLHYVIVNVLYAAGRTFTLSLIIMAAAGINLLLNIALIPRFAGVGAGLATCGSYLALAVATSYFCRTHARIAFPWLTYALVVTLVLALYLPASMIPTPTCLLSLSLKTLLLFAYLLCLFVLRLYSLGQLHRCWIKTLDRCRFLSN